MMHKVFPITSLSNFLSSSKKVYEKIQELKESPTNVHIILGNESADLDSIVSSITYAYFLHQTCISPDAIHLPLINMTRNEIHLRNDVLYLLKMVGISLNELLFLEDVNLNYLFHKNQLQLHLVDHNVLCPTQQDLAPCVCTIIDHHLDENETYPFLDKKNKSIAKVGSTATLIAEKFFTDFTNSIPPDIALCLMGAILMDTSNLQSLEKTTNRDVLAIQTLEKYLKGSLSQNFYNRLEAYKQDISNLTPSQLLMKDFKTYLKDQFVYGISSLPKGICWGIENEAFLIPYLENLTQEKNLSLLILLMINKDSQDFQRKVIVFSQDEKVINGFETLAKNELQKLLIPGAFTTHPCMRYYYIENYIARKELQPYFHFAKLKS